MTKEEIVNELKSLSGGGEFIDFERKILCTNKEILGVRTPDLKKLAKKYKGRYEEFKTLPDDIYEVTFLKLKLAETLEYEKLLAELPSLLCSMDSWPLTDTFKPKAIQKRKADYLSEIKKQLSSEREFLQRFALVTLLSFYREKEDLPVIFKAVENADNEKYYYVHMASAWLVAEVLVHHYDEGSAFLKRGTLPKRTHNKAIQKARESFRITAEQKEELNRAKLS